MKCAFCAEQIQDEAILCRYCGAEKKDGQWTRVEAKPKPKGAFTMSFAAACFLLSAVWEVSEIVSPVPLFGAMRGGVLAFFFHAMRIVVFAVMGVGLWKRPRWGYRAVMAGTAYYTLERLIYIVDGKARHAELDAALDTARQIPQLAGGNDLLGRYFPTEMLLETMILMTVVLLGCWWGFAIWVHLRRAAFDRQS
jgi:hypothetical protein